MLGVLEADAGDAIGIWRLDFDFGALHGVPRGPIDAVVVVDEAWRRPGPFLVEVDPVCLQEVSHLADLQLVHLVVLDRFTVLVQTIHQAHMIGRPLSFRQHLRLEYAIAGGDGRGVLRIFGAGTVLTLSRGSLSGDPDGRVLHDLFELRLFFELGRDTYIFRIEEDIGSQHEGSELAAGYG